MKYELSKKLQKISEQQDFYVGHLKILPKRLQQIETNDKVLVLPQFNAHNVTDITNKNIQINFHGRTQVMDKTKLFTVAFPLYTQNQKVYFKGKDLNFHISNILENCYKSHIYEFEFDTLQLSPTPEHVYIKPLIDETHETIYISEIKNKSKDQALYFDVKNLLIDFTSESFTK